MVTFGGYALRAVVEIAVNEKRLIEDELIPGAKVGLRRDVTTLGREIGITGEIREDPDAILRIEELRVRQDDVARDLDLEDGSGPINAKLVNVEYSWDVMKPDRVPYHVTFHETS